MANRFVCCNNITSVDIFELHKAHPHGPDASRCTLTDVSFAQLTQWCEERGLIVEVMDNLLCIDRRNSDAALINFKLRWWTD